jgi:acyl dehydratase
VPIDPSFSGRSYPPTPPYRVGREKIREFADAIGAADPAYRDPEAARALGHPDVVAPPTFPIALSLPAGQVIIEDLGVDYARVVHGDQRFAYTRPIVAGDELTCACMIEEIMSRAGIDSVTTRTDVTDATGAPVVSVWTRLIVRGNE